MNYKIIADSSSNLLDLPGANYASVPLKIVTSEKEYVDNASLDTGIMLADLAAYKGKSGTSCPNVGEWLDAFGDADWVFTVAITSNLSGCHNAAVQAREAYLESHPDRKVCCLDTLSTGPEMVLIVEKLVELISRGLSFEAVEAQIREYMKKTHLMFMLESLDNLAKNGRVSSLVAKAVGFLGIRIVGKASDEGTLQQLHKCRGQKKGLETMLKEMEAHGFQGGPVRIVHGYNLSGAEELKNLILTRFPDSQVTVGDFTGLCCFYAEKGGVMAGFEG